MNRMLRVMKIEGGELPEYDAELTFEGKVVGRVTSAVRDGDDVTVLAFRSSRSSARVADSVSRIAE